MLRKGLFLTLLLLLTACGGAPQRSAPASVDKSNMDYSLNQAELRFREHMRTVSHIDQYQFSARALVKHGSETRRFHLDGVIKEGLFLDLSGPFHMGRVRLIIKPEEKLFLLMNDEGSYQAPSVGALTLGLLGNDNLPVAPLKNWFKGIPSGLSVGTMNIDQQGHLKEFSEEGYVIYLTDYQEFNGVYLPGKITIKYDDSILKMVLTAFSPLN